MRAAAPAAPASVPSALDWGLLVLPGVIWGASFLFIAEGLEAMAPDGVAFMRIAIAFAVLSFAPAARQPIDRRDWRGTALLAVLWFAFPMNMFPYAEQHVSSSLAGNWRRSSLIIVSQTEAPPRTAMATTAGITLRMVRDTGLFSCVALSWFRGPT